jgi:hypothetical protein
MLKLFRELTGDVATIGYLDTQPHRIITLERPWVAASIFKADEWIPCGRKGVSCVPPGRYQLVPHNTEAHPHTVAASVRSALVELAARDRNLRAACIRLRVPQSLRLFPGGPVWIRFPGTSRTFCAHS